MTERMKPEEKEERIKEATASCCDIAKALLALQEAVKSLTEALKVPEIVEMIREVAGMVGDLISEMIVFGEEVVKLFEAVAQAGQEAPKKKDAPRRIGTERRAAGRRMIVRRARSRL